VLAGQDPAHKELVVVKLERATQKLYKRFLTIKTFSPKCPKASEVRESVLAQVEKMQGNRTSITVASVEGKDSVRQDVVVVLFANSKTGYPKPVFDEVFRGLTDGGFKALKAGQAVASVCQSLARRKGAKGWKRWRSDEFFVETVVDALAERAAHAMVETFPGACSEV